MEEKKIIIAEDDRPSATLLEQILSREGYKVDTAFNGRKALEKMLNEKYDALLTDWMMPEMDGIELIRRVRDSFTPAPVIIIITALSSNEARAHALKSGADSFIGKPYETADIINQLRELFSQKEQVAPQKIEIPGIRLKTEAPFYGVAIAASSGGPKTIKNMLNSLPVVEDAAFFIVQHAPAWILKDMARAWNKVSTMNILLGEEGMDIAPGNIYLAPGDRHMTVSGKTMKIHLKDDPPENHVRPAADPLFRSVAQAFGDKSVGIVLTGMGCDGALGCGYIRAASGFVIAQDPKTAIVYAMPQAVIHSVNDVTVTTLNEIPGRVVEHIKQKKKIKFR